MYYELYTNVSGKGRYVVEISHDYNSSKNLIFKFSVAVESDDVWEVTPEVGNYYYNFYKQYFFLHFIIIKTNN